MRRRTHSILHPKEVESLKKEIEELASLAADPKKIQRVIIKELTDVKKKYAEPRHTTIVYEHEIESFSEDELAPDYPVKVFLTTDGYFKKITPQSLRMAAISYLRRSPLRPFPALPGESHP